MKGLADAVLPLFAAADAGLRTMPEIVERPAPLVPMKEGCEVVEDYGSTGLSVARQHWWPVVLPHPKMLPRRRELSQPNAPWFLSPLAAAKPSRVTDDACSDVPVSAVADPPAGAGRRVR